MAESLGRLLIVDDEQPVLEVLSEYFATQGYAVETVSNGVDALEAARRARPDLVLLDIRMTGMDGLEVLKRLRQLDSSLAVIMVTANEDVALARETLKLGAFDYVSKPFDFRYLDRAVSAGLVHSSGPRTPVAAALTAEGGGAEDEPWRRLLVAVFRAVRDMPSAARDSIGERLEVAAVRLAREAASGSAAAARPALVELDLLLAAATELGDLPAAARSAIDTALGAARKSLPFS